ncbi:MAG: helix-turn-helix domain-containing protein [Candidatus Dormibacteraceae bacterium]
MITVPEAAARIGKNPETIRRWIRNGKLSAQKIGTQHMVEERDLRAVLTTSLPLPPGWNRTWTGETMPNWVGIIHSSRQAH